MNQPPPNNIAVEERETSCPPRSVQRLTPSSESAAHSQASPGPVAPIAGDILYGADAIALFLFGDIKHRRRVYNLVEDNGLPVFRIGVNICARKSVLLQWIATQERVNLKVDEGKLEVGLPQSSEL